MDKNEIATMVASGKCMMCKMPSYMSNVKIGKKTAAELTLFAD